ncbi:MAG: hypothetical protein JWM64_2457 [Frankiales bacterium]|nr:hypothetical protein [Frankiales bacterium]
MRRTLAKIMQAAEEQQRPCRTDARRALADMAGQLQSAAQERPRSQR